MNLNADRTVGSSMKFAPADETHPLEDQISIGVLAARAATQREKQEAEQAALQDKLSEILEITEDFANYVALRSRGISVATRERRKLRMDIEAVVVNYIAGTSVPRDLKESLRPPARVQAITAERPEPQEEEPTS